VEKLEYIYNRKNILLEHVYVDTRYQKSTNKKSTKLGWLTADSVQELHLYGFKPILPHPFRVDRAYNVQKRSKNVFSRVRTIDFA
jgi:hypothetical protein